MTVPPSRHVLGEGVFKNYSALIQTCKRPGWYVREHTKFDLLEALEAANSEPGIR